MEKFDAERARRFAWFALAIYIVALGVSATVRTQGDFRIYYRAGEQVLHGGEIYPLEEKDRFLYAPIFAIGFAPLAAMPIQLAQLAFFVLNAFGLVQLIRGAGVLLFGRGRRLPAELVAVPIILVARMINNNVDHGQINLPTLALIVWAIIYSDESSTAWAGLMIATAVLIKPFALLGAAYLVIRRRFAALGWAIVAGMVLLVAPVLVFGPHGLIDQTAAYVHAVASMTGRYRTMLTNQSAVSAVARLMSLSIGDDADTSAIPMKIGMGLELALTGVVLIWNLADSEDRLALCALFCIMPSFAPVSWKSYFAALLVPYMALLAALWTNRSETEAPPNEVWLLFGVSALLNLIATRTALFFSAHFISSLFALAALYSLWLRRRGIPAQAEQIGSG
ncbi:MAG TPA: glycosyltransferase family 87 protein [Candidatus Binataceae bacterium]|nr:glycosyltransferase family 87 protein [Candidatus Binataceae bacterium]